jgi:uncharacterized protein
MSDHFNGSTSGSRGDEYRDSQPAPGPAGAEPAPTPTGNLIDKPTAEPAGHQPDAPARAASEVRPLLPTQPGERIEVLDILRGFAIFGILVVNIWMSYLTFATNPDPIVDSLLGAEAPAENAWWEDKNRLTSWIIVFFFQQKFYSLFSFLFGLGLGMQIVRGVERGRRFGVIVTYARRLLVLLLIGLVHAFFIWDGDILVTYAILGFPLLLFSPLRPWMLTGCGVLFILLQFAFPVALEKYPQLNEWLPPITQWHPRVLDRVYTWPGVDGYYGVATAAGSAARGHYECARYMNRLSTDDVLKTGTYEQITLVRIRETVYRWCGFPWYAIGIFGMFLFGLAAGKAGVFRDIPGHMRFWRRLFWAGLIVGLLGHGIHEAAQKLPNSAWFKTWIGEHKPVTEPPTPAVPPEFFDALPAGDEAPAREGAAPAEPSRLQRITRILNRVGNFSHTVGIPMLCFFYIAAFVRITQSHTWRKGLAPMGQVGRMALTNYLMQSVIHTYIFCSYGYALHREITAVQGVALAVVIYLGQVGYSVFWFGFFRFGPMEWLWRVLTYGRVRGESSG